MVDKQIKKESGRSDLAKHNNGAGPRYESLEKQLEQFIEKLNSVKAEMDEIKQQQAEILNYIKSRLK
jgi:molecular chaperone GrpE (heat shock protein)